MSLMNQLFGRGVFDLILEKIFLLLDGPSLGACSLVCKEWQRFILKLFKRKAIQKQLQESWANGVPTNRRILLDSKFMAIKVDTTSMVVGLEDGSIECWQRIGHKDTQVYRNTPFQEWTSNTAHKDFVRAIDLSPNYIVSGSRDTTIRLWNRQNGICIDVFQSSEGPISGIYLNEAEHFVLFSSLSGKIKKLLFNSDHQDKTSRIDSMLILDENFELNHGDSIEDMVFDESRILSGGNDAKLKLWDLNNPIIVSQSLIGHSKPIKCVYLKGNFALSGSRDHTARLWNVIERRCLKIIKHTVDVRSVFFNSFAIFTGEENSGADSSGLDFVKKVVL